MPLNSACHAYDASCSSVQNRNTKKSHVQVFFSHFEHVGDAGGFDGDFSRLLHSLFPPSTKKIGRIDLFIVGDGARESGFAHVRVFDEIVVPDLDGDGFGRESAIEDELLVESRIEIVFDGFRAHGFTAAN